MPSWLKMWLKLGVLLLIGWFGFGYQGAGQALVRTITTIVVASTVASTVLAQLHSQEFPTRDVRLTHTELIVEMRARPLLRHYGALGQFIEKELDRVGYQTLLPSEDDAASLARVPPDEWHFIFLGPPGTGDSVVWSTKHKNMFCDETLIHERLWEGVLEGKPEAESEPHLVFELTEDLDVYRMYLRQPPFARKPDVTCSLPVALLTEEVPGQHETIAQTFGLRWVPDKGDPFENSFGEWSLMYDGGSPRPCGIYENDLFRFKVCRYSGGAVATGAFEALARQMARKRDERGAAPLPPQA